MKLPANSAKIMQPACVDPLRPTLSARRRRVVIALCALPLAAPPGVRARADVAEASEEKVKAAYLYRFLSYVAWPAASFAGPAAPYMIGVAGDDAVTEELARITAGKTVGNRALTIRRLAPGEAPSNLHMLFIGRQEAARQAVLLRQLRLQPVLTVTEADGALGQGSMINFHIADNRVRFEASLETADQAGIKLDSRLLGVATHVVKGAR